MFGKGREQICKDSTLLSVLQIGETVPGTNLMLAPWRTDDSAARGPVGFLAVM